MLSWQVEKMVGQFWPQGQQQFLEYIRLHPRVKPLDPHPLAQNGGSITVCGEQFKSEFWDTIVCEYLDQLP